MHRAVLDTNIYVSSVFWEMGNPHKIIEKAIEGKTEIFISNEILKEIEKVLKRDFEESEDFIQEQINLIKGYSEIVEGTEKVDVVKDDPDDNIIIECAMTANAEFIVSGDRHLLNLKEYAGIKIITPKEFIDILNSNELYDN